jgi:hypothetical protein
MSKVSIAVVNSDEYFNNDRLFDLSAGLDNGLEMFRRLKEILNSRSIEIHTSDILAPEDADIIVFIEVPDYKFPFGRDFPGNYPNKKCFLLLFECQILRSKNYDAKYHVGYDLVFTWDDDLVELNPDLYSKFFWPQVFSERSSPSLSERTNFMACVSGNKKLSAKGELYSERLKFVKFYEQRYPDCFSLFGSGWDELRISSDTALRPLNFIFRKLPKMRWLRPSYKGFVDNKIETLSKFKFNLCFENFSGQNGYITEKIFDSFAAGCIPVYWGPDNIEDYIPPSTYINYQQFESVEDCHTYLVSLTEEQLLMFETEIDKFLSSDAAKLFCVEVFATNMANHLEELV